MAPHIDPPIHQNPIFHSFFPTTFSNSIPLHPPHPRITKYFLNEHTINFPPVCPTIKTSFSHFQPASHLPPSVQIFSVPFFNEHTNSPRPKKSHHFLSKTQQILPFFTNPLRTAPQLHCFTTFSIKTSPLAPQRQRRRAVLQHELDAHQPFLVGLQETRLQDSVLSPDQHYFTLQASAKQDGSGGCALWLSKHVPYARAGVRSYYLQEQHFVVTGHSDRHINVSIAAPHLKLFVVVAHCPSLANHPQPIVEQLWRARRDRETPSWSRLHCPR